MSQSWAYVHFFKRTQQCYRLLLQEGRGTVEMTDTDVDLKGHAPPPSLHTHSVPWHIIRAGRRAALSVASLWDEIPFSVLSEIKHL